jgi:hypothetical protein
VCVGSCVARTARESFVGRVQGTKNWAKVVHARRAGFKGCLRPRLLPRPSTPGRPRPGADASAAPAQVVRASVQGSLAQRDGRDQGHRARRQRGEPDLRAARVAAVQEHHAPQRGARPPPAPRRAGPGPPPQPPGTVRPCHGRRRLVARALLPARMPEAPTPCSRGAPVRTTSEDQAASSPHLAGVWGRRRRDAHAEPPERRRGPDPTLPAAARRCRRTRCTRSTRARPQRAA